jgi:Protein of unknown function (DUF1501)
MKKSVHALVALLGGIAAAAAALADDGPTANAAAAAGAASATPSSAAPAMAAAPVRSQLWSYQPVKSQEVPGVKGKKWVRTPVDAFVLAYQGTPFRPGASPILNLERPELDSATQQRDNLDLLKRLNAHSGSRYPQDTELQARLNSYELAYRMESAAPDAVT